MASGQFGLAGWRVDRTPSSATVTITGEVDLSVVESLRTALYDSLLIEDVVMVNLGGLSFIDSTGLRFLLDLKRKIESTGGALFLTKVSQAVERVLDVTGMGISFEQRLPDGDGSMLREKRKASR